MSGSTGTYRTVPHRLLDETRYQSLSPDQRLVLLTLRISLSRFGIDLEYADARTARLAHQTGLDAPSVGTALSELLTAGFIDYDDRVFWVVDQLADEPSLQPSNDNHRKAVQRHVNSLPDRPMVARFKHRYRSYFPDTGPAATSSETPKAIAGPLGTPSNGIADALAMPSRSGKGKGKGKGKGTSRDARSDPRALIPTAGERVTWLTPVAEVHERVYGAGTFTATAGAAAKHLSSLWKAGNSPEEIGARYARYLDQLAKADNLQLLSLPRFVATFGKYAGLHGPLVVEGWMSDDVERRTRPEHAP